MPDTNLPIPEVKSLMDTIDGLNRENRHLRLLLQISQELGNATNLEILLDRAIGLCRNHLGFESAIVRILEGEDLKTIASYGFPGPASKRVISLGEGLTGQCAATAEPILIRDVTKDDRYVSGMQGARSNLCVPLISEGEVLGVLNVESTRPDAFDNQILEIALALGSQLAARIRMTRLSDAMAQLAMTDALTGLPNYPHFMARLEEELSRAERYGHGVSLVVIDLDNFKAMNDTYGHLCGNFILEFMGRFLKNNLRKSDIAARFGGEEFCILLPHTPAQQAAFTAEKIRVKLNKVRLDYLPGSGEAFMDLTVTATFGVSGIDFTDLAKRPGLNKLTTAPTLIHEADDALYQGKNSGKNCVILYQPGQEKNKGIRIGR